MPVQPNEGMDPNRFAESARALLLEDRTCWRKWGVYWFLVKALLRKRYSDEELPLGDHMDETVIQAMGGQGLDLPSLLKLAAEEFTANSYTGRTGNQVESPDGEHVTLIDPDMGP